MNYGLYLSAAGVLNSLHRQDIFANNLANVGTVGFKADMVTEQARLAERLESNASVDPNVMLEQLGGGAFSSPTQINLHQGDLAETRNDLDLAVQGDGFFVVNAGKGPANAESIRFTRDGRFTLNSNGDLIMAANGMRVLDAKDSSIHLNSTGKIQIDSDGNVEQNGVAVAKLQIATVADKSGLTKEGGNVIRLAAPSSAGAKRLAADGVVKQGFVESSSVDPIMAMNAVINASKAVQANATMMQYHDNILGQAVNTLGRVT